MCLHENKRRAGSQGARQKMQVKTHVCLTLLRTIVGGHDDDGILVHPSCFERERNIVDAWRIKRKSRQSFIPTLRLCRSHGAAATITRLVTFVNGRDHPGKDATVHVFDGGIVAAPVILWCLARSMHALVSQVEEKRLGGIVLVHNVDGARREDIGAIVALRLIEGITWETDVNPKADWGQRDTLAWRVWSKVASGKQRDAPARTKAALYKMGHNWAEVRRGSQSLPL